MKIRFLSFTLICVLLSFSVIGCGPSKPSDLPRLFPCTITVTQKESPLADATVRLVPTDNTDTRFTIGGKTNVSGVVELKTDITWSGVPKGKYKVCISKLIVPDMGEYKEVPKDPEEYEKYTKALQAKSKDTVSVVDAKYNAPRTTPLIIEITENGFKETIDVGAAVSNSLDSIAPSSSSGKKK